MTLRATAPYPLLLLAVLLVGCASVPSVEERLRTLRFHPNMYVVQAGDTLETIAFRYELSTAELAALNPGLERRGMLPAGERINVRPGTRLAESVRVRARSSGESRAGAPSPAAGSEPAARWEESSYATASPRPDLREAVPSAVPRRTSEDDTSTDFASDAPVRPVREVEFERVRLQDEALLPGGDVAAAGAVGGRLVREEVRPAERREDVREEVLPDDYDIGGSSDAASDAPRAALDDSLQRYVGRWTWPIDGAVARAFAPDRIGGQGVDIAGVPGQKVRAAGDGTVVYSGRDLSGEGQLVILRHEDDLLTTYSHADELYVSEEARVRAGEVIASLGWNERRESVLGFEVRRDGNPLDPMAFLPPR